MVALLRLLLLLWPAAEIVVMILVAEWIGIGWTVLALLGAALAGMLVIRVLGAASLAELRGALARREAPTGPLLRGACAMVAGMLLILPGFIGDVIAVLLLLPPLRAILLGALWRGMRRSWASKPGAGKPGHAGGGTVIEGEYHEMRHAPADRQIDPPPPGHRPPEP
jgi:UPF0716 protein FxsA